MTNKTIDQLDLATLPLSGADELVLWQGGATKKTTVGSIGVLPPLPSALTYYVCILAGTIGGGSSYTAGTYTNISLTGGGGSGAKATITVTGGAVTDVVVTDQGSGYVIGNVLSATAASIGGTGSGFTFTLTGIGDDNNDGLAIGTSFRTFTRAYRAVSQFSFVSGFIVTVNISDGIYVEQLLAYPIFGAKIEQIYWNGNVLKPLNCALRPNTNSILAGVITASGFGNVFQGIHFDATDAGFLGFEAVYCQDADVDFNDCAYSVVPNGGWFLINYSRSNISIGGGIINFSGSQDQVIRTGQQSITGLTDTGNRGFVLSSSAPSLGTAFFTAENYSTAIIISTFTGWGSTTGKRFTVGYQSSLLTTGNESNGTYLPGDMAGTLDSTSTLNGAFGLQAISGLPTTTQLPVTRTGGVFKDTVGGGVYLAYNDGGSIKKVELI